jgi:hypothetical protein
LSIYYLFFALGDVRFFEEQGKGSGQGAKINKNPLRRSILLAIYHQFVRIHHPSNLELHGVSDNAGLCDANYDRSD